MHISAYLHVLETFSLGFKENVSHKGVDSSETVMTFLGQVGACVDLTDKDILEMFDLWGAELQIMTLC